MRRGGYSFFAARRDVRVDCPQRRVRTTKPIPFVDARTFHRCASFRSIDDAPFEPDPTASNVGQAPNDRRLECDSGNRQSQSALVNWFSFFCD